MLASCHASRMRFSKDLEIQRAMVIYAHPDDAEFSVAGTIAKWAKAGVEARATQASSSDRQIVSFILRLFHAPSASRGPMIR